MKVLIAPFSSAWLELRGPPSVCRGPHRVAVGWLFGARPTLMARVTTRLLRTHTKSVITAMIEKSAANRMIKGGECVPDDLVITSVVR